MRAKDPRILLCCCFALIVAAVWFFVEPSSRTSLGHMQILGSSKGDLGYGVRFPSATESHATCPHAAEAEVQRAAAARLDPELIAHAPSAAYKSGFLNPCWGEGEGMNCLPVRGGMNTGQRRRDGITR